MVAICPAVPLPEVVGVIFCKLIAGLRVVSILAGVCGLSELETIAAELCTAPEIGTVLLADLCTSWNCCSWTGTLVPELEEMAS